MLNILRRNFDVTCLHVILGHDVDTEVQCLGCLLHWCAVQKESQLERVAYGGGLEFGFLRRFKFMKLTEIFLGESEWKCFSHSTVICNKYHCSSRLCSTIILCAMKNHLQRAIAMELLQQLPPKKNECFFHACEPREGVNLTMGECQMGAGGGRQGGRIPPWSAVISVEVTYI